MNQVANEWKDYECIDTGNGEKLERWKDVILRRPDPQALWPIDKEDEMWKKPHAHYHRSKSGGGHWEYIKPLKNEWKINYKHLTFKVSPTGFKHTGLFPEQAANWDFMMDKIKNANREIRVLNLFAYTGGATMACASAGASEVVHVDASKGMVQWAKENMELSHLEDKKIRFIVDDVIKFVEFFGGCNGNLKGIASLVAGMKVDDAIAKLKGIRCGFKSTSCPDQLAKALESMTE